MTVVDANCCGKESSSATMVGYIVVAPDESSIFAGRFIRHTPSFACYNDKESVTHMTLKAGGITQNQLAFSF